ncbi:hypothetical protein ATCC90586_012247 [Pythium insidiosum]|nr:hypothetical protein ATCC90586_012247 [Pythium insidiosum]
MQALSSSDLERLHAVKQAFDKVARVVSAQQQLQAPAPTPSRRQDVVPAALFFEYCGTTHADSLAWLVDDSGLPLVAPLTAYAGSDAELQWSSVFVFTAMRLHAAAFARAMGQDALRRLAELFAELALDPVTRNVDGSMSVWQPAIVAAIERETATNSAASG